MNKQIKAIKYKNLKQIDKDIRRQEIQEYFSIIRRIEENALA